MNNFYIMNSLFALLLFGKLQLKPTKLIDGTYKVVHLTMFGSDIALDYELFVVIKQYNNEAANISFQSAADPQPAKIKVIKLIHEGNKIRLHDPKDTKMIAFWRQDTLEISNLASNHKSELTAVKLMTNHP